MEKAVGRWCDLAVAGPQVRRHRKTNPESRRQRCEASDDGAATAAPRLNFNFTPRQRARQYRQPGYFYFEEELREAAGIILM